MAAAPVDAPARPNRHRLIDGNGRNLAWMAGIDGELTRVCSLCCHRVKEEDDSGHGRANEAIMTR